MLAFIVNIFLFLILIRTSMVYLSNHICRRGYGEVLPLNKRSKRVSRQENPKQKMLMLVVSLAQWPMTFKVSRKLLTQAHLEYAHVPTYIYIQGTQGS